MDEKIVMTIRSLVFIRELIQKRMDYATKKYLEELKWAESNGIPNNEWCDAWMEKVCRRTYLSMKVTV